jgi:HlyD family secretion protein
MRRTSTIAVLIVLALAAALGWWLTHPHRPASELTLYGDVDLRQVDLAFNGTERVAAVLASEGDKVRRGQVLGVLDTARLKPQAAQAAAATAAQAQAVLRLRHGARPEEIAEARASVAADAAAAVSSRAEYDRLLTLAASSGGRALSHQDLDNARSSADEAAAKLEGSRQALQLQVIGPRREDIAQAEALLEADRAQQAIADKALADARLVAPLDAVVRTRLIEPGDMATPQRPAFSLAIVNPKWVRAYVAETELGAVRPGMAARVTVDAFPHRAFAGWVGFISPAAEFTPKTVETPDLRTSLVYEVRVFVRDPNDDLRLGMPATVHLPLTATARSAR